MISIFAHIYAFVQHDTAEDIPVPQAVKNELLTALALAPLLPAGLNRPYLSELLACDAAPEYGFGVSLAKWGSKVIQQVGRMAERRGDYVRLLPEDHDMPEKSRIGNMHRL